MTRTEYVNHLKALYLAANNSDNEGQADWMRGDESAVHCQLLNQIVQDMGLGPNWLEEQNFEPVSFEDFVATRKAVMDPSCEAGGYSVEPMSPTEECVDYKFVTVSVPSMRHCLEGSRTDRALYLARGRKLADKMGVETTRRVKVALGVAAAEQLNT